MGAIEELSTELVSGLLQNGRNLPDASKRPKPSTRALLIPPLTGFLERNENSLSSGNEWLRHASKGSLDS